MKANVYDYDGNGIKCIYDNKKWVICLKNWKPNNDITEIKYLEVHHKTDEQFILLKGKAILLAATRENDKFDIDIIMMEPFKVYNIPQGIWFNTITQKDTKIAYIQDSGTTSENSEYCDMLEEELKFIKKISLPYLE